MLDQREHMVVLGNRKHIVVEHWEHMRNHIVVQQREGIVLEKWNHIVGEQREGMDSDHGENIFEHQRLGNSFGCWRKCNPLFDVRNYSTGKFLVTYAAPCLP